MTAFHPIEIGLWPDSPEAEGAKFVSPDIEDKVMELTSFGLTPLQAKVYIHLTMLGPRHASSLGRLMNINRADIYRLLKELRKRGVVEVLLTEPSKYAAIDPGKAVNMLIGRLEQNVNDLKDRSSFVIEWLYSISNVESGAHESEESKPAHFKLKHGKQMLDSLQHLVQSSKIEILKIWSPPGLKLHISQGLLDDFIDSSNRGVKIRGIVEITKDNLEEVFFLNRYAELRHNTKLTSALRYTISDKRQALINATSTPLDQKELVAFWTDNESIVNGLIQDFERLWMNSHEIAESYRD